MTITTKSDAEIIDIVQPMIDEVVKASNKKDWAEFSKYQTQQEAQDPANKRNVLKVWEEEVLFTSLTLEREILGVLRKGEVVQLIWKQTSDKVPGDFLARYFVKEMDLEIKEVGFQIN